MEKGPLKRWDVFINAAKGPSVDLYHESEGEGSPLLMIHGFCTHIYTWRHVRKSLAKNSKLFMVDLKGFGNSPVPDDGRYSVYDQAHAVLHFIRKHDLKKLTLLGHSFGGGVTLITALYLLEKMPGLLEKIILIDSVGYPQKLPPFLSLLHVPFLGETGIYLVNSRLIVRGMLMRAYFDTRQVGKKDIEAYAGPFERPGSRKALLESSRHMVPHDLDALSSRYKGIDVPVLIMWGREDKVVPLSMGEHLNSDIKNSRLVIFDDCGHVPQEEKPEETSRVMEDFIESE